MYTVRYSGTCSHKSVPIKVVLIKVTPPADTRDLREGSGCLWDTEKSSAAVYIIVCQGMLRLAATLFSQARPWGFFFLSSRTIEKQCRKCSDQIYNSRQCSSKVAAGNLATSRRVQSP